MKRVVAIFCINLGLLFGLLITGEAVIRIYCHTRGIATTARLLYPMPANDINGFRDPDLHPEKPDDELRVLCLGGSTSRWANYPLEIRRALQLLPGVNRRYRNIKVVSAGDISLTSLDSLWRYRYWYDEFRFDLVIYYHGINDLRANNCPPGRFRRDYSHYSYYRQVGHPLRFSEQRFCGRLRSLAFLYQRLLILYHNADQRWLHRDIPINRPVSDWLPYGNKIRSPRAFRANTEAVVRLAQERATPVVLITFCHYIPDNYSRDRMLSRQLDYRWTGMSKPVELWGEPAAVRRGIGMHNEVLREVAEVSGCLFFDQAAGFPRDGQYYIDVCHFSPAGIRLFAERLASFLADAFR